LSSFASNMYPVCNVSFCLVAWGSFVSTDNSEDIDERHQDINPKPCVDISPEYPLWAKNDECRKAIEYTSANYPMSCDICNPSLTLHSSGVTQHNNFSNYFQSSTRDGQRLVPETCQICHPHCVLWASKEYHNSK
jgi:hypothetical protein